MPRWQLPPQSGSWSLNLPADSHALTLLLEQPLHLKAVQYILPSMPNHTIYLPILVVDGITAAAASMSLLTTVMPQ